MKVLGLGTSSIALPVYGGQRRNAAFREEYRKRGIPFRYVGVCSPLQTPREEDDFPAGPANSPFDRIDGLQDVCRGLFAERSERLLEHLSRIVTEMEATHLQLEHCFLFPAFDRLRQRHPSLRLIYSSHNVEAPLKEVTLRLRGVQSTLIVEACQIIDAWDRASAREADLVSAASQADAETYLQYGARAVVVARSGVSDFPVGTLSRQIRSRTRDRRFLLTVGSGHPPNWEGFARLILDQSHRFSSPPTLLVCGGMASDLKKWMALDLAKRRLDGLPTTADSDLVLVPQVSDEELGALKQNCHGFLLPILSGGGSNLKTAEALLTGKHVVGTRTAFRGFEEFMNDPGVVIADTTKEFKDACEQILRSRLPSLTEAEMERRQAVRWDRSLAPFFSKLEAITD